MAIKLEEFFDPSIGSGAQILAEFTAGIQGLSRNYKNFAKNLDADGQKVAAGLGALATQTAALRTAMASVNTASEQERTGYAALSTQLQQLFQEQQRLLATESANNTIRRTTTEGVRVLTSELRQQQQAFKEAYAAGNTEGLRTAAAEILKLKANSEDLNRALRGANSIYTATAGSYRAMENEARQLGAQLKALEGGVGSNAEEVQQLKVRLADVNAAIIKFGRDTNDGRANVGRYVESIQQAVSGLNQQRTALLAGVAALRTQAQATNLSAGEQQHLQTELKQTEAELSKVNGQLLSYGVSVGKAGGGTSVLSEGAAGLVQSFAGAYIGIQGVAKVLQDVFEANIKYSDSVADVAKTTGLTIEQTNELANSLKKLDTRTSLQGLLDIAEVGGQLGVAAGDIESFTKVIDISVQALGNDFSGGASEIATALGKINTVFGRQLGGDLSENLLHIGSALNQLGAVGAATAPQLSDVALRTGAVAANAGLGLDKVLSYAAVLQEVGVSAETSGSALNRLFSTISTKTKASFDIAKLGDANLTLKEFKRLVNTDFEGAIQAFLKGLKAGGNTTTRMNALLATLKLQSGEAKSAIVTLAENTDLYAQRQAVANQELKTGTSVAAEAAIKNNTLGGSYEKLKNSLANLFTQSALGDFFKDVIDLQRERFDQLAAGFNKLGQAFDFLKEKAGVAKKPVEDFTLSIVAHTKSLGAQADAQQGLLDNYTKLAAATSRNGQQELDLAQARARLVAQFGGADAQAIQARIDGLREEAAANKGELETKLKDYTAYVEQTAQQTAKLQEVANKAAVSFSKFGLSAEGTKNLQDAAASGALMNQVMGRSFPAEQVTEAKKLNAAQDELAVSTQKLARGKEDLARIAAALAKLNGAAGTKEQTRATDDDVVSDKKKKQSVADIAKEEYLLQKQRLQARLADLDRQADNPANTAELRNQALTKSFEVRRELASLERNEEIREAVQANKDKIGGDAATAKARVRIQEAYQEDLLKITRDGDKKLVALRNAMLNQLGELDKIGLDSEIAAAEKVRDNVNKTYDERQRAAREVAHAQIELARLVHDEEVRNALGALDKIEAANAKFEQARQKASASVKVYDSAKDIDEQSGRYARLELAVEDSFGKQLLSQQTYDQQVRGLENRREADAIAALEAEYGETEEVLRRKLALRRKLNQQELTEEQEKERKRAEIVQATVEKLQAVSGAYFDFQSTKLQAAEQNEQLSYDAALKAAGDNTALKERVEKDHAKRIADIRRKQAENERDQALFSIVINTSMAVAKSLGQFGLPLAIPFIAADIAAGALQTAAVLARPIPQYFKGRENGPAEFAHLAEQGPELVGKPGSYRLLTTPTVGYLEQGDRVLTAPKTRQLLAQHLLVDGYLLPQPAPPASAPGGGRAQVQVEHADLGYQATRLRDRQHQQHLVQLVALRHSDQHLGGKLDQVRRAVEEQEYYRKGELDDIERTRRQGHARWTRLSKRYLGGPLS